MKKKKPKKKKPPNWSWFRSRLEDVSLLRRSVTIVCGGYELDLAVPVDGSRRGGYVCLPSIRCCEEAVRLLANNPGFPNLRIERGSRTVSHTVCWGEPEPEYSESHYHYERGRFFGYSDKAIQKQLRQTS